MFGSTLDQRGEMEPGCNHSISTGCNSRRAVAVVAVASCLVLIFFQVLWLISLIKRLWQES